MIWSIFYQVDPSNVRHQKRGYAKALAKYERQKIIDKEKVKQWRLALEEAANLSGWHFKHGCMARPSFIDKLVCQTFKIMVVISFQT
jgi:L1 cell adhesion molecule like protein